MKSHTEYLTFKVPGRVGFVNITREIEEAVRKSGVQEGLVWCNAMHITASVFINDNESGLHEDYKRWLEKLAPHEPIGQYEHNRTGEDNVGITHTWNVRGLWGAGSRSGEAGVRCSHVATLDNPWFLHAAYPAVRGWVGVEHGARWGAAALF